MTKSKPNGRNQLSLPNLGNPLSFNPWAAMALPALEAFAEFNGKVCETVTQFNKDWVEFLNRRLEEDFGLPERLSKCTSPQEIQQVYGDFWTKACAQYQDGLGRIAGLNQAFARETAAAMSKQVDELKGETQLAA